MREKRNKGERRKEKNIKGLEIGLQTLFLFLAVGGTLVDLLYYGLQNGTLLAVANIGGFAIAKVQECDGILQLNVDVAQMRKAYVLRALRQLRCEPDNGSSFAPPFVLKISG